MAAGCRHIFSVHKLYTHFLYVLIFHCNNNGFVQTKLTPSLFTNGNLPKIHTDTALLVHSPKLKIVGYVLYNWSIETGLGLI
jgi:hypothetical protein